MFKPMHFGSVGQIAYAFSTAFRQTLAPAPEPRRAPARKTRTAHGQTISQRRALKAMAGEARKWDNLAPANPIDALSNHANTKLSGMKPSEQAEFVRKCQGLTRREIRTLGDTLPGCRYSFDRIGPESSRA
jgi:hypothetical protein